MKNAWTSFWSKSWKIKAPVLVVAAFVVLSIIGAASGGGDEEPKAASADETVEATATKAEKATNTPKPTETPKPTATPLTFEEKLLKSYRDNKGFMVRATDDGIALKWDEATGEVNIDLYPKTFLSDGDVLTIAGHSAIVANRAIWSTYPEVKRLKVNVWSEFTLPTGQKQNLVAGGITVVRSTASLYAYDGLKDRELLDNKSFFCVADGYVIHPSVYTALGDKGCLVAAGAIKYAPLP